MEVLSLGEKIKKRRKELDMTLKDVAGDRVTPGQISLVESGKSNPSMDLLEYLAATLDVSVEYFMESEVTQAETICKYYNRMAEINLTHGDIDKALAFIDKADKFVDKYNLSLAKARNLFLRGVYKTRMKEYEEAYDYLFKCNLIYSSINYYEGFLENFMFAGKSFLNSDSIPLALSYFHKSESLFKEEIITDEFLLGKVYFYLAIGYQKTGKLEKAKEYTRLCSDKFEKLSDRIGYGNLLTALAEDYEAKGNLKEALTYSSMALDLFKDYDSEKEYAMMEQSLGELYMGFEDYDEALSHFMRAKDIYSMTSDSRYNDILLSIVECQAYLGRHGDSLDTMKFLEKIFEEDDSLDNLHLYRLKSKVQGMMKNSRESLNNLILAAQLAKTKGYKDEEAEVLILLSKYYLDRGKTEEAEGFLDESVGILNEISGDR